MSYKKEKVFCSSSTEIMGSFKITRYFHGKGYQEGESSRFQTKTG